MSPLPPIVESKTYLDSGRVVKAPLKVLAGTTPAEPDIEWWRVFHDSILTQLEARVAGQNLDVQTASLRLRERRAELGTAAAAALPQVNSTSSACREQYSQNGIISLIPPSVLNGGSSSESGGTPRKIRVNTITPGPVATPFGQKLGLTEEQIVELFGPMMKRVPLGRMGDAGEVAAAALYFASDESGFTTGAELVVDGGLTIT